MKPESSLPYSQVPATITGINFFKIKINKRASKQVGSKFRMFLKELVGVMR
jgi:hypothetical protein